MPYVVLITGAGSGLGHGFAKHYLTQPNTTVIAADITYNPNLTLEPASTTTNTTLHKLTFDISSATSIDSLNTSIKDILAGRHIDLLIHSAGIRGLVPDVEAQHPDDVNAAETLSVMDTETLIRTYMINTAGTFTLLQRLYLSDLFHAPIPPSSSTDLDTTSTKTTGNSNTSESTGDRDNFSKVILMTSRMGSISSNTTGSAYAYRASKAALNAIIRSMAIDVPHVVFLLVHPGRVETGLTLCREEGAIEVGESVGGIVGWIHGEGFGRGRSGAFVDRWGREIAW